MYSEFKNNIPFEKRKTECNGVLKRYPDRIPCIIEMSKRCTFNRPEKTKFLIPQNLSIGQLQYVIRKRIKLSPDLAMFMFINNVLIPSSEELQRVYQEHKDEDGFLYVVITSESTFG
jgi:GABA(A) receptor-associated protein